ncbi:formate dehydrogenase N, cytochrome b-556 subunit [Campylobacter blaseri]|uniref:Formate dehydrogenase subunit gamma n=1 Tax=Campylobacter blaseri TaxID=2042961 RepID=A0A2P8R4C0_9BACT|nr:formate dehydrogenase subunit gamma [Campylobacter blaseri]PSM53303.1 formate dehydrogenase subunit gamma [Campylobacter blaseri]PSM54769.1 formate dehydrogenase subunit gamma [Campylobacter blaseri]QKF86749.1 formate dehydrogenase N, cytochrome b-556 subunit [Campylobacter blaseri]
MKKILLFLCCFTGLFATNSDFISQIQHDSLVWAEGRATNIPKYYDSFFTEFFVTWQANGYFAMLAAVAIAGVIAAFAVHYAIVGPKIFSHDHGKVYAFNVIERLVHAIAAVAWVILVPTGVIIMFGDTFGGGAFVKIMQYLHLIATVMWAIVIIPMFLFWAKRMLPAVYDIRWAIMVGGYLSKDKKPIPAGKFNFGQKAWFWVCTLGGFAMIITGAIMYFIDFPIPGVNSEVLGISQIDLLRISAVVHNLLGVACAVFLLVHIYMAAFAIKGAIHSMINGYKEEEEVYILHHYWYQELLEKGKIQKSVFENQYTNLI